MVDEGAGWISFLCVLVGLFGAFLLGLLYGEWKAHREWTVEMRKRIKGL